jgi:hypothetical protein
MKIGFILACILPLTCCLANAQVPSSATFQTLNGEVISLKRESKPAKRSFFSWAKPKKKQASETPIAVQRPASAVVEKPNHPAPSGATFQTLSGEAIPLNAESKPAKRSFFSWAKPKKKQASETPITFQHPAAAVAKKPDLATAPPKPEIPIKPKASSDLRMRLPDMLSLPEDSQLRSAPSKEPANKGGVIARPPAE